MKRVIILLLTVSVLFGCAVNKENTAPNNNNSSSGSSDIDNAEKDEGIKQVRTGTDGESLLLVSDGKLELRLSVYLADTKNKAWKYLGGYSDGNVVKGTTVRAYLKDSKTVRIKGDSFGEIEFELFSANDAQQLNVSARSVGGTIPQNAEKIVGMLAYGSIDINGLKAELYSNPKLLPDGTDYNVIAIVASVR